MIFGQGKTPDQIKQITKTILDTSGKVVVTRAEPAAYEAVIEWVPDALYDPIARVITAISEPNQNPVSGLTVVCAGTSDLPVAMEAILTAEVMGCGSAAVLELFWGKPLPATAAKNPVKRTSRCKKLQWMGPK